MNTILVVRRRAVLLIVAAIALAIAAYGLGPLNATASSHREAPLIAADPAVDNTDLYAFVSPERPDSVTFVANWIPFEEPNGGPNFYPFATDARVRHQHRQRRRRQAGRHLPVDVQEHRQAGQHHVPVQQRPGHLAQRREPAVPADLHAGVVVRRRRQLRHPDQQTRRSRRRGSATASMPDYGKLRDAGGHHLPGRREGLRRPGRRPVLPGPAGVRPALRRRPQRGRPGHAGRLQREHHRAAGAVKDVALNEDAERNPVIGVWSTTERPALRVTGAHHAHRATGCRSPGWATRWSTRSSCRPV